MTPVTILRALGATPEIDDSGRLTLDLASVPQDRRPEVVALAKQHKDALVRELTKTPKTSKTPLLVPEHLESVLVNHGYTMPEWTPEGCRQFLAELQKEWPGFEVRGWYGLAMPEGWPVALRCAVQSIYATSLQDQGGN